jgi:hypothetical protein
VLALLLFALPAAMVAAGAGLLPRRPLLALLQATLCLWAATLLIIITWS